jgi:Helix-turn-helix domain
MTTDNQPLNLLTPRQAAKELRVSPGTLAIWRCKKRYPLKFVKIGRKVFYRYSDLVSFVQKRTVER